MAKAPNGRKLRDFDKTTFEGLCHIQCTVPEIQSVLKTDIRTVDRWCQRTYEKTANECLAEFREGGKASLRRYQYNLSKKNCTMAIWLGKQWLGQRDIPQEMEQFNGNLAKLLDMLLSVKSKDDFTKEKDGTPSQQQAD